MVSVTVSRLVTIVLNQRSNSQLSGPKAMKTKERTM